MDRMRRSEEGIHFMRLLPLCLLLLGPLSTSWATTIQFDELGTVSPIDVNGIHIQGVMFGFSPDRAFFNEVCGTAGNPVLSVDPVLSPRSSSRMRISRPVSRLCSPMDGSSST